MGQLKSHPSNTKPSIIQEAYETAIQQKLAHHLHNSIQPQLYLRSLTQGAVLLMPFVIAHLGGLGPLAHDQLFFNPAQNWLHYTLQNVTLFVDFVNISRNTGPLSWPQFQS
jgi:hypothetical protein